WHARYARRAANRGTAPGSQHSQALPHILNCVRAAGHTPEVEAIRHAPELHFKTPSGARTTPEAEIEPNTVTPGRTAFMPVRDVAGNSSALTYGRPREKMPTLASPVLNHRRHPLRSSISVHTDVTIEHGRPVPRREPMAQPHKDHRVVDLMSRRGVMGLGATAAALGLGACGDADPDVASAPPDSDTDLSGSLVLWAYPMDQANDAEWYQPHIDSFQEKFPGIDVEVVMQPWEGREEQLTASITGGNAP